MAGSKRWFEYVSDNGTVYGINLDESNTEAVNPVGSVNTPGSDVVHAVPRNIKMRYALYSNSLKTRSIRAIILTQTSYNTIEADHKTIPDPAGGAEALAFVLKRPEILKPAIKRKDTGLTDGDTESA